MLEHARIGFTEFERAVERDSKMISIDQNIVCAWLDRQGEYEPEKEEKEETGAGGFLIVSDTKSGKTTTDC
ncbi:hypothetical protein WN51_00058 [Melipona quadrifasciata]|uniref:Uncharacterized protein n=1 Tax=Melipona quadrifasciata TaxID=166423 RepID=A0A0N0BBC6_9HYME|nr:hypothetical protein WN51_00058 [Melipona quadrifasciata]